MQENIVSSPSRLVKMAIIIALVQFVNALESMMISPLFPFMAKHYNVSVTLSGYVTGCYMLATLVSGLFAYFRVSQWHKKHVLLINLCCLSLVTLITPFTEQIYLLILLRLIAGIFGGITLSIGISLLLNQADITTRGKLIAIVLSSFSFVSIIGLPFSLYLATHFHWQWAFYFVGFIGIVTSVLVAIGVTNDQIQAAPKQSISLNKKLYLGALLNGISQFSPFILVPILVPLFVEVLKTPLTAVPWVFFIGGVASLLSGQLTGKFIHHYGETRIIYMATALFMANMLLLLLGLNNAWLFMTLFMLSTYARIVATASFAAQLPDNIRRAKFDMLHNTLTNLAAVLAFFLPSILLSQKVISLSTFTPLILLALLSSLLLPGYLCYLRRM